LPYNSAVSLANDGTNIYTACGEGFFVVNPKVDWGGEAFSKAEGMSDLGMQCVAYDPATSTAVLVYADGNIDLYKDNNFYNIPDLKLKAVAGTKQIYYTYVENGMVYLSTSLGVVVLDLTERNISEVYQFYSGAQQLPVYSFTGLGQYFYASSTTGLYRIAKNSPQIQNYLAWQQVDSTHTFFEVTSMDSTLYMATTSSVYQMQNDTIKPFFTPTSASRKVINISPGDHQLFVSQWLGNVTLTAQLNGLGQLADSFLIQDSTCQVMQMPDSSIWLAGYHQGLGKKIAYFLYEFHHPSGPVDPVCFDVYANNNDVWVAHGSYSDRFDQLSNYNCFSNCKNGSFKSYLLGSQPAFDTFNTVVSITKDESTGNVYAGSFGSGLMVLNPVNDSIQVVKQGVLDPCTPCGGTSYDVVGTAVDPSGNVWAATMGGTHELNVKDKATGNWYKYNVNIARSYPYAGGPMAFDNSGNVWYASLDGDGVIAYSTNNTISDVSDDSYYQLRTGVGYGNIPNYNVYSIAHDQSDNIWIGTADGIGIVYNASQCISNHCDAEIPIVQYDQYAGYLFKGENVRTIAVDGGNRKWVGTDNGVWLLSPDAGNSSIIYRFTVDNSPLPSNHVLKIAVDQVTGDVYIGTDNGLVCYRSTATGGGTSSSNVITFPNPVPSGYSGTIAIKGLVTNADVRITDINGQLVYRTTALGGQAVWNGVDYKGHRPQSGVYLIFASSPDGSQTYAGKMVFMQ